MSRTKQLFLKLIDADNGLPYPQKGSARRPREKNHGIASFVIASSKSTLITGCHGYRRSSGNIYFFCPFHHERTPSCVLYLDGHFHCYGCAEHGSKRKLFSALRNPPKWKPGHFVHDFSNVVAAENADHDAENPF